MNAGFLEVYQKYLTFKKNTIEPGSYESLLKLRGKVIAYEKKQKRTLLLSEVTMDWFKHFTKGLSNGKYGKCTNSTIKLFVGLVNSFLKQCQIFGYTVNQDYIKFRELLKNYKIPKFDRPVLTDEELAAIWNYKGFYAKNGKFIKITSWKKKVRGLFVFQTQVGFRWSDIKRLKRKDIVERNGKFYVVNFTTKKSNTDVSVQLNQLALKIIFRYAPKFLTMPVNQPVFKKVETCSNATHVLKWISEKVNLKREVVIIKGKLKKIIKKVKYIYQVIATHIARRKFATDWMMAGKDIYLLKIVLGHSSIKTTEKYIQNLIGWIPKGLETTLNSNK